MFERLRREVRAWIVTIALLLGAGLGVWMLFAPEINAWIIVYIVVACFCGAIFMRRKT